MAPRGPLFVVLAVATCVSLGQAFCLPTRGLFAREVASAHSTTAVLASASGRAHTDASKSKISLANKGKTPWNKGGKQSEATRAKIAATTLKNARLKKEAKAQGMGLTLEEWEAKEEELRAIKRSQPRTVSDATRAKISAALKDKWANQTFRENSKSRASRPRKPHTPEAKKLISDALKKKWAEDPEYREKMLALKVSPEAKEKISASLRKRWLDPTFRELMANRKRGTHSLEHRQKISKALTMKWRDPNYRASATAGSRLFAQRFPHSPEVKQRISAAVKATWADRPKAVRSPAALAKRQAEPRTLKSNMAATRAATRPASPPKAAKPTNVLAHDTLTKAIEPKIRGFKTAYLEKEKAEAAAVALLSEDDAEAARIAHLKETNYDLWSALYAADDEIMDLPIVSKARANAVSVGRR